MGGSGCIGQYGGATGINGLKDVARRELQRPERRRIFISFRHTDLDKTNFLRMQAKNKKFDLDFIDMSLRVPFNSDNADYIKMGIRARIEKSSVTVVIASDDTHESDWVNWEINETIRMGKGVVIIDARRKPSTPLPSVVGENKSGVKVVPWKIDKIMKAIKETAK